MFGAFSNVEHLHITVAVGGPFESILSSTSEYIIWVDSNFFTKTDENLRAKHLEEDPWKGVARGNASLASPSTHH